MTKETKKDVSEYFRDSFKGKNYWTKKLKPKYEHFSRACLLFILFRYKMHRMVSHPDNMRKNSKQGGEGSAAVTLFATDYKLVGKFLLTKWLQKRIQNALFSQNFHLISKMISQMSHWGWRNLVLVFVQSSSTQSGQWLFVPEEAQNLDKPWGKILTKSLNWLWTENHFVYL